MKRRKVDLVKKEGLIIEEKASAEVTEAIEEVPIEEKVEEPKQQPNRMPSKALYYQELLRIKRGGK